MRPLKLTITGFCSYGRKTVFNLEKFGKSGLYLITGKTGSGKTTIFDGICFALYGEPSGANRSTAMLRSTYSTLEDPTEVQLEFELRSQKYVITRNPAYTRKSKKGNGETLEQANAVLELPDGRILEGPKVVDKKIIEILGIDKDQFTQIVMLAQGDFQKLLVEDTVVRQNIFRKLFKTDNYQKLQKKLLEMKGELTAEVTKTSASLNQYFAGTRACCSNPLLAELENIKQIQCSWSEKISLLKKIIESDRELQSKEQTEYENNLKKLKSVELSIKEAEEINELKTNLEQRRKKISELSENSEKLKAEMNRAKDAANENTDKERKAACISNDLVKYSQLENKKEELKRLLNLIEINRTQFSSIEQENQKYKDNIESLKNELEELEPSGNLLSQLNLQRIELENKQKEFSDFSDLLNLYEKNSTVLKKAQSEYIICRNKCNKALDLYQEKNQCFMDGQAGVLALSLKEKEPCPVCGSLEHPAPATLTENIPSESELKELKKTYDDFEKEAQLKSSKASEIKGNNDNLYQQIKKYWALLLSQAKEDSLLQESTAELQKISEALIECKKNLQSAEKKNVRIKEIQKKLPELQKSNENYVKNMNDLELELAGMCTKKQVLQENINDLEDNLEYKTKLEAEKKIKSLQTEIENTKILFEKSVAAYTENDKNLGILSSSVKELEEKLSLAGEQNLDELKKMETQLNNLIMEKNSNLQEIFAVIQGNNQAFEKIQPEITNLENNEKKLVLITELSNTANGNIGQGKAKIMLETYVQMAYFDRIIAHANTRFMGMSNGQYELVRKKSADNAQSQTGLELNIIDHYRGCQRDVKSLSGGETFEASLSLALGLSDEISESAGGIRIDTMFVDEGFGTLDSDTLQKAYKALLTITEGNRLVGIISHVDYLKQKIDNQIGIIKDPKTGSLVDTSNKGVE